MRSLAWLVVAAFHLAPGAIRAQVPAPASTPPAAMSAAPSSANLSSTPAAILAPTSPARTVTLASTTSTEQSGLFAHLLPAFRQATGITVRVVAVGTGQALDIGRRGDADVVLVHDRAAEGRFVAEGHASRRLEVMYNDFVLLGPADDPAGVRGRDIVQALRRIAATGALFISRGDGSGTHAAEKRFWGLAETGAATPVRRRECGCGMGPALNIAASAGAYILADRGTWLGFANRGALAILVERDPRLFNPYSVMAVDPARHPHVNAAGAQRFIDWLVSPAGQDRIASYRIGGQQLFFPNAGQGARPAGR